MSKIVKMSPKLANLIAAGEVVERPSSVVKELVENSIDAKASMIKVYLKNGGIDEIIVVDDGEGMDKDDVLLAFLPHATSKIKNEYDLQRIKTLGFRGEAIASIAEVSNMTISSSQDGKEGYMCQYKYGIKQKIVSASVKYSVHSKYTMFKITDKNGWFNAECDIDKCSEISSGWYENSLVTDDNLLLHSGEEIRNMEVIKKQRANGRFIPNTSRSKEAIALYTAQIVLEMCNKCPNVMMYKWHLRKSVLFLLDYIENAESAVIPDDIMLALEVWNSIFGGNDEASQKIEVLNYFHNEE